jgi:hypothetical protein
MHLRSAEKHLQRKHYDCKFCRDERLMVHVMQEKREAWFGDGPLSPSQASRA